MPQHDPIGLFDSGVGGVSVMREVRRLAPNEHIVYFADQGYCPYGGRPEAEVRQRAFQIADFLLDRGAKLLVVACNTASIAALDELRERHPQVPIVGMEPAVKPAAAATTNGRIGVLATTVTLHGERFASLLRRYAEDVAVFSQPGTGLVERVEAGQLDTAETRAHLGDLLRPLQEAGVDTLVLGSTHYPFLRPAIERIMGPQVTVIDTGVAVARQTVRVLSRNHLGNPSREPGWEQFYSSGELAIVAPALTRLWDGPITVHYHD